MLLFCCFFFPKVVGSVLSSIGHEHKLKFMKLEKEEWKSSAHSRMEFLTYAAGMSGMQDSLIWPRGREDRRVGKAEKKSPGLNSYVKILYTEAVWEISKLLLMHNIFTANTTWTPEMLFHV